MGRGKSKAGGGSSSLGASARSTASSKILNSPVETRTSLAYPRTEKQIQKSEALLKLRDNIQNAPVGTTLAYQKGNTVHIWEKTGNSGGRDGNLSEWGNTEISIDKNGKAKSSSYKHYEEVGGLDFVGFMNMRNNPSNGFSKNVSKDAMDLYKKRRKNGDIKFFSESK